jgi:hypothetical protein
MREFDEVLDKVLRSQPEPKEGIERRILLRVFAETRSASRRRKMMWMGVAASLLLTAGIVRVAVLRVESSRRPASSPTTRAVATEIVRARDGGGYASRVQTAVGSVGVRRKRLVKRAKSAVGLRRQGPDEIARIEIAPLSIEPIGSFSEGFTKQAREVKANEDVSWSDVVVCDGGVGGGNGAGKAYECGRSYVRYAVLSADAGAEVYGQPGRAAGAGGAEHHD